ncbi:MAG: PKD domain-containing protein, partial [Patescibacteria group bacterium]|nr:PKD domain-containing protein [Patescibacteria group bacterium]
NNISTTRGGGGYGNIPNLGISDGPTPVTDASGNVTLWLFPGSYGLLANPQSGGIYAPFSLSGLSITGTQTEVISLQFVHATPITTANLANRNSDGTYSNPTTVTLSATAASGYTVANTFYTIDGGSQQTYTAPFTISGSGNHTITYWSIDNTGVFESPNSNTFTIKQNQPPSINPLSNITLNEGDTYSTNGSFSDSDSTSWTSTVDYGDGSSIQPLTLSETNFTLNHIYKDEGIYTVTVVVVDNQGASSEVNTTVTVNNAPFTVSSITAPTSPATVNTSITASASFIDPGVLDTHNNAGTYWNWGDGSTTSATVTETNGSGTVSDSHTYAQAGVYTVTLTVQDDDGVQVTSAPFQYITVYNPTGGFLTASGKYISQPGWDLLNPQATGEVKFGVSAQYPTGSNSPTGNTKLMFKVDNLDFTATSYSWLVVNTGKAYLMGTGTIQGSSDTYTFLVTALDSTQTIRFQLRDNTTQNIVYDTQPGVAEVADPTTPLTQGSIKVH